MALNWSTVSAEHVRRACELVAAEKAASRKVPTGLVVVHGGAELPAKQVMKVAYCLANEIPLDSTPKFASGESTLTRLRALGFEVKRNMARTTP